MTWVPDLPMRLLEFPHSHYCEKARWALDFKGIPFDRVALLPGFHMRTVRRHAAKTSVPVLLNGNETIQGSSEIIDYLDHRDPGIRLTPQEPDNQRKCEELERQWSEQLGEPIRTILYDRLLAYPSFIGFCFTHTMAPPKRFIFRLYYPFLRKLMHQVYVRSADHMAMAKETFATSLDALEETVGGDHYLFENHFTRADLSLCAMLSLLVLPPEFPVSWPEIPDPEIRALMDEYHNHPVCTWVRRIYELHRT